VPGSHDLGHAPETRDAGRQLDQNVMATLAAVDNVLVIADIARTVNDFRPLGETLNNICLRVSGLQGYEIRAQARGIDGEAVTLVQWVRFGSGGFLRVVGVTSKENWDALFTRFRAIRDGVEPK